jgi:hypothetical protein
MSFLGDLTTQEDLTDHDKVPEQLYPITKLYLWSAGNQFNSDYKPFHLFLDLVGWSLGELGELMFRAEKHHQLNFGHLEMDMIGKAVSCWAERPTDTETYINKLIESEYYDY